MRNLHQYPITFEEIIKCLEDLEKSLNPGPDPRIGDMQPLLVKAAINILRELTVTLPDGMHTKYSD